MSTDRIEVMKTYKLFINGAFPRSESGKTYEVKNSKGTFIANASLASRKDLRDAVSAARGAQSGWNKATAYNKGQILYRVAEMLEARKEEIVSEIVRESGLTAAAARKEVIAAIDYWVWAAGWSDKYQTVVGSTNPVTGPFYNFTSPESLGVVVSFADASGFFGLCATIATTIVTGNTVVAIAQEKSPLSAIALAEIVATSDVPAGVINILTGKNKELAAWTGSHMDVDGVDASGLTNAQFKELEIAGAENLKRIHTFPIKKSSTNQKDGYRKLERLTAFLEFKTIWHPVGL
jgi:acyl-CoA reductase-like NAD-dependent aldehyde dehydrogenase